MLHAFFLAWLGVCAAQASPGPNMMAVAEVALGTGRRPALFVVAGIASGSLVWAAATALGLGALFSAFPTLLTVLKFLGGAYLLFIAVKALLSAWHGRSAAIAEKQTQLSNIAAWRRGFFVVMTNPKAVLMWSAIATFLFGADLSKGQVLAFGPLVALSALIIYGAYGLLFSTNVAMRVYGRFSRIIEVIFGALFGAAGVTLIASGIKDMRP